uniref:Uncharacterized protein n=1 Tax=Lepeophtheirus salmonis TaxID=72036 RepID=A0A0K2UJR4_LEPSM
MQKRPGDGWKKILDTELTKNLLEADLTTPWLPSFEYHLTAADFMGILRTQLILWVKTTLID